MLGAFIKRELLALDGWEQNVALRCLTIMGILVLLKYLLDKLFSLLYARIPNRIISQKRYGFPAIKL